MICFEAILSEIWYPMSEICFEELDKGMFLLSACVESIYWLVVLNCQDCQEFPGIFREGVWKIFTMAS